MLDTGTIASIMYDSNNSSANEALATAQRMLKMAGVEKINAIHVQRQALLQISIIRPRSPVRLCHGLDQLEHYIAEHAAH